MELGSGTCLTVTTIFTRQPLSLRREIVMETVVVLLRIEAPKQVGVEALEPGHVKSIGKVGRPQATGIEGGGDGRQRRAPVGRAHRLGPPIDAWHRGVAATRGGDGPFGQPARHVRHVAGDGEDDLVAGDRQSRLDARQRARGFLAVEDEPVGHEFFELLGFGERDHHLGEGGTQTFHHPAQQVRFPHLEPGLRPAHAAALTAREHKQRGLHHHYHRPAVRAIDFHVHLPTPEWLDASMHGYVEAAESYFRSRVVRRSLDDLASDYADLDVLAVLLAWDAETATGRPRVPNELVAQACREHPQAFTGFGSVDPLKGDRAVDELDRISELGLKGVKLHPSLQAFAPDDEKHWPLYERCEELGLIVLFHTGTSGIGAGQPGGQGIRLDYARPIRLDAVAASFPSLNIIAAHFGYPWQAELLAMALHKTNIYIDISGWAPRYIPSEVIRDLKGRLQDQFVFGSDYPFIQPKRCLDELATLEIPEPVLQKVLLGNGKKLLGLS